MVSLISTISTTRITIRWVNKPDKWAKVSAPAKALNDKLRYRIMYRIMYIMRY